jgi:hypothetical protein
MRSTEVHTSTSPNFKTHAKNRAWGTPSRFFGLRERCEHDLTEGFSETFAQRN